MGTTDVCMHTQKNGETIRETSRMVAQAGKKPNNILGCCENVNKNVDMDRLNGEDGSGGEQNQLDRCSFIHGQHKGSADKTNDTLCTERGNGTQRRQTEAFNGHAGQSGERAARDRR